MERHVIIQQGISPQFCIVIGRQHLKEDKTLSFHFLVGKRKHFDESFNDTCTIYNELHEDRKLFNQSIQQNQSIKSGLRSRMSEQFLERLQEKPGMRQLIDIMLILGQFTQQLKAKIRVFAQRNERMFIPDEISHEFLLFLVKDMEVDGFSEEVDSFRFGEFILAQGLEAEDHISIGNGASIRKDRDDHTADLFFGVTVLLVLEDAQENRYDLILQKFTNHRTMSTYIFNALQHQNQLLMSPYLPHPFHQDLCDSKFTQNPMKRPSMRNLLDNPQQIHKARPIMYHIYQLQQSSYYIPIDKPKRLVVLYKYGLDFFNCALDVSLLVLVKIAVDKDQGGYLVFAEGFVEVGEGLALGK